MPHGCETTSRVAYLSQQPLLSISVSGDMKAIYRPLQSISRFVLLHLRFVLRFQQGGLLNRASVLEEEIGQPLHFHRRCVTTHKLLPHLLRNSRRVCDHHTRLGLRCSSRIESVPISVEF